MTNDDPFDGPGPSAGLRASDAEREQVADALRRHHADGRLSSDEFEERVERCYQARTVSQLHRLTSDLPRGDGGLASRTPAWVAGPSGRRPVALLLLAAFAVIGLLGSVAGHFGPGYHPHPPVGLLLLLAFVAWRFVARRRAAQGGPRN